MKWWYWFLSQPDLVDEDSSAFDLSGVLRYVSGTHLYRGTFPFASSLSVLPSVVNVGKSHCLHTHHVYDIMMAGSSSVRTA